MQIHENLVVELAVALRLDHTRCYYQCQNIIPSDVGAIRNTSNDASVRLMK